MLRLTLLALGGLALGDPIPFPRGGFDLGEDPSVIRLERARKALACGIGDGLLRMRYSSLRRVAIGSRLGSRPRPESGFKCGGERTSCVRQSPDVQDRNEANVPSGCFLLEQISSFSSPRLGSCLLRPRALLIRRRRRNPHTLSML